MCEFCHKHGEGKKWYLQANNYSQDLLADLQRRHIFVYSFFLKNMKKWGEIKKAPFFVRAIQEPRMIKRVKNMHFGQVLPIEDVEQVFDIINTVIRFDCPCRKIKGVKDVRYCYGISLLPRDQQVQDIVYQPGTGFVSGDEAIGMEKIGKEEALENFRQYEKEGLCHSIWTALTPFIVGICNCDRSDCFAVEDTIVKQTPTLFRAEYVAELNQELCNGCRACMRVCPFGALGFSAGNKKAYIDQSHCFGCGICRSVCTQDAISLRDRASVPTVAHVW